MLSKFLRLGVRSRSLLGAPTVRSTPLALSGQLQPRMWGGSYGGGGDLDYHKMGNHMDVMPVPAGKWQDEFNTRNKKRNLVLGAGVVFFLVTSLFIASADFIFFNFHYPQLPPDIWNNDGGKGGEAEE